MTNGSFPADLLRDVASRRTFAIISHPDAGKTTLTEKLLLFGGAIQLAGTVKARKSSRHATSDWMEIEKQRGISVTSSVMQFECAPVTWPLGMGKRFRGVFDLLQHRLLRFTPGEARVSDDTELIEGLDNPRLDALFPDEVKAVRHDVDLLRDASHPFDLGQFLAGKQSPVFFGSAINNFGVREILRALTEWAPAPQPRDGGARTVLPGEAPFTGFVFKIQANMDLRHRDRIAFFRVCSGRYRPAMKAQHQRIGREMKLGNVMTFMANERVASQDAVAGDIIGIHNHGLLQIGDTLTE